MFPFVGNLEPKLGRDAHDERHLTFRVWAKDLDLDSQGIGVYRSANEHGRFRGLMHGVASCSLGGLDSKAELARLSLSDSMSYGA
jgi:hypothetical protein